MCSCQEALNDGSRDIGQPIVAARMAVSQLLMLDAELLQDGRLQIMYMHGLLDDVVAEVVSRPVDMAAFDPRATTSPERISSDRR